MPLRISRGKGEEGRRIYEVFDKFSYRESLKCLLYALLDFIIFNEVLRALISCFSCLLFIIF